MSATYVDYRTGPDLRAGARRHAGAEAAGRGRRASCSTTCTRRAASRRSTTRRSSPRPIRSSSSSAAAARGTTRTPRPTTRKVDAIEVVDRPAAADQPVHALSAIDFWERALGLGHKIAAVGSSDSHNAGPRGRLPVAAGARSGRPPPWCSRTSCRRPASSAACRPRHTYVKLVGNKGPDVRLTAQVPGKKGDSGIIGDVVRGQRGGLHRAGAERHRRHEARPAAAEGREGRGHLPHRDGHEQRPRLRFHATEHGRYRLQLERGPTIEVVSSPIWFESLPTRPGKGCGDRNHAHEHSAACKK